MVATRTASCTGAALVATLTALSVIVTTGSALSPQAAQFPHDLSLSDEMIAAGKVLSLNSGSPGVRWTVKGAGRKPFPASIPGVRLQRQLQGQLVESTWILTDSTIPLQLDRILYLTLNVRV